VAKKTTATFTLKLIFEFEFEQSPKNRSTSAAERGGEDGG
jgi:hypothetical protein